MQNVSKKYKDSMQSPYRNRGYIRVSIGIINSNAQKNVNADYDRNEFAYFSDIKKPFNGYTVDNVYATSENNFSKIDGTMYFLPPQNENYNLYNNGLVTNELLGAIYIAFGGVSGLDIKGLTIDFGEYYPTDFTIENDSVTRSYNGNQKRYFVTEDVFDSTSYLIIRPSAMVNGQGRLRIHQFSCGIVNTFTNKETRNYTSKEFVSSITETIPSNDVTLTVDNQNMYYSPNNPDSALAYMEIGQEVKTEFGYDIDGNGTIEWLPPTTTYLKSWSADDVQAKFTATDRFDYLTGKYYKGLYRENGISLYDLAIDVLNDAGITDEREYFLDPYLKDIVINNPLPVVKHSEALQIIANAGRCALFEDRQSRIHMQSSFIPDMVVSVNNETEYSHGNNILIDDKKDGYANSSNDFSLADGTLFFLPKDTNYLNTGYISNSVYVLDTYENSMVNRLSFRLGNNSRKVLGIKSGHWEGEVPKITINLEAAFVAYGILIRFRNVAPEEFHIITYYQDILVNDMIVKNSELEYITNERFDLFDKMVIEFTKGYPNSRLFVDNVLIGDITDYVLSRNNSLTDYSSATRQKKIKSISVIRTQYNASKEEIKELKTEELVLNSNNNTYVVYFSNASYGLAVSVIDNENITAKITESSNYFANIVFDGITEETVVKYSIQGYEYEITKNKLTVNHNDNGEEKEWKNPLINSIQHAKDLEEWLSSYFLGDIEYQIKWRGDPRTDANDLFYLELKDRDNVLVRTYQNELRFSGAWSGTMKARKAVL